MDEKALKIGRMMINCAVEHGYFDGVNLDLIEELAEVEKGMFIELFRRLDKYQKETGRNELTSDEISSMFSFVFARSVEAVVNFYNGNAQEIDYMGIFDGKIPFYSDDRLTGFVKKSLFPRDMAEGFLNFMDGEKDSNSEPVLALFEALKWTWRFSQHLALQQIEEHCSN
jgi:hypothetical protein